MGGEVYMIIFYNARIMPRKQRAEGKEQVEAQRRSRYAAKP